MEIVWVLITFLMFYVICLGEEQRPPTGRLLEDAETLKMSLKSWSYTVKHHMIENYWWRAIFTLGKVFSDSLEQMTPCDTYVAGFTTRLRTFEHVGDTAAVYDIRLGFRKPNQRTNTRRCKNQTRTFSVDTSAKRWEGRNKALLRTFTFVGQHQRDQLGLLFLRWRFRT